MTEPIKRGPPALVEVINVFAELQAVSRDRCLVIPQELLLGDHANFDSAQASLEASRRRFMEAEPTTAIVITQETEPANRMQSLKAALATACGPTGDHSPIRGHVVGRDDGKTPKRQGRNEPCKCGSRKKSKRCCGA